MESSEVVTLYRKRAVIERKK